MDVDKAYEEFFNICATAVGIKGMGDCNDKEDMIKTFAARVEYLEVENRELKEQIIKYQKYYHEQTKTRI